MIFHIGYLILITAAVLALFGMIAGFWGGWKRHAKLTETSFHAVYAVAGLVATAAAILWYGFLADQFRGLLRLESLRAGAAHLLQIFGAVGRASGQPALLDC